MEICERKSPGTLWATPGLLRDSFTVTFLIQEPEDDRLIWSKHVADHYTLLFQYDTMLKCKLYTNMRSAWTVTCSICCDLDQFNSQRVSAVVMSLLQDTIWPVGCQVLPPAHINHCRTERNKLRHTYILTCETYRTINFVEQNIYWATDRSPVTHEIICLIWHSLLLASALSRIKPTTLP
jgi:hypothetical protein